MDIYWVSLLCNGASFERLLRPCKTSSRLEIASNELQGALRFSLDYPETIHLSLVRVGFNLGVTARLQGTFNRAERGKILDEDDQIAKDFL